MVNNGKEVKIKILKKLIIICKLKIIQNLSSLMSIYVFSFILIEYLIKMYKKF
jgi:hypothetical protein